MTVERGQPWGVPGSWEAGGVVVRSDAEARRAIEPLRRAGAPLPALGLLGGDLARTLGATGDPARLTGRDAVRMPVDLASVLLDGRQFWFLAHLVARRSWWRGRIVAVMNAQYVATADVAPRAHPGDGKLDVVDVAASMPVRDRLRARGRLRQGTHLPHPAIDVERVAAWQATFDPPLGVWLDGEAMGAVRHLSVRVEPDAVTVLV